jgi:hypothetical protein
VLGGERLGAFASLGACGPYGHDLRAQRCRGAALDLRRVGGHHDDRANTKGARRIGDTLSMVAAGVGDDASTAL